MKRMGFVKRLLCLSALVSGLFLNGANAQFNIGIKVSGNASSYKNLSSLNGGVDVGLFLRVGKKFYFQPEACYSFRTSKLQDVSWLGSHVEENTLLKQHFVDVPLLLGYHFINKNLFKMHLFIGPRFGLRIGSNLQDIAPELDQSGKYQWAGQVGLGFDIWRFTLDARYDLASDRLIPESGSESRVKSTLAHMIVVSLGFKFIK